MVDRLSEAHGSRDAVRSDRLEETSSVDVTPPTNLVSLSYLAPPEDLSGLFGPMYLFVADKLSVADHTRADFAQIRFMLSGTGDYSFHETPKISTPPCCMLGPTTAATRFDATGPVRVIGVSVLPLGWAALGAGDAAEVADNLFDLTARFGPQWAELQEALCQVGDAQDAASLLWPFLRSCIRWPSATETAFVAAVDVWLADERSPRVDALQETTGLSSRQIARLCNRYYGSPPKYLARKYRALRCALILARDNIEWADLCDGAFYDQSHFIREFKHFLGLTPNQLRDDASLVIRLTMGRRDIEGTIAKLSRIS